MNVVTKHAVRTVGDLLHTLQCFNQDLALCIDVPGKGLYSNFSICAEAMPDPDSSALVLTLE